MKRSSVCCDGTWKQADEKDRGEVPPTNVVTLARSVAETKMPRRPRIVYYEYGGRHRLSRPSLGGAFDGLTANTSRRTGTSSRHFERATSCSCSASAAAAYTVRSLPG